MSLAEVKTLYDTSVRDIPGMLRKLALDIEQGTYGEVAGCVTVLRSPAYAVTVFGHGEEDWTVSLTALELGRWHLLKMAP